MDRTSAIRTFSGNYLRRSWRAGPGPQYERHVATKKRANLFSALLKYWRRERGMSQLDLSLAADVSSRHVSFMETGRAKPSREMVLVLASVLNVPLRDQNAMLQAAGFEAEFAEPSFEGELPPSIENVVERMLSVHEPYPMVIMNRRYDVLRMNAACMRILTPLVAEPAAIPTPINGFALLFDPRLIRPYIVDWPRVARTFLSRLHRESLASPQDEALGELLHALLEYPGVPDDWRTPDLSMPTDPTLSVWIEKDGLRMGFLTTLTVFSAPQNVTLEELRIESYFPLDDATAEACRRLAG
jgi:transcriptional regulator with XRE-family HTH domain